MAHMDPWGGPDLAQDVSYASLRRLVARAAAGLRAALPGVEAAGFV